MLAALAELKRDPSALAPLEVGAFGLALRLVTPRDVADGALIERLGAWRAEFMANYPTQFPVTTEGTAGWLRDHVLGDADRLMFLIVDADDPYGAAYGHMGFDHAHPSEPVLGLSNVLKGDRERLPRGAMEAVEERMLAWAHEALGVVQFTAEIFEDNRPSCALHERLGFVQTGRRGLRRHVDGDRVAYRPLAEDDNAEPDRWWIRVVRAERSPRGRGSVARMKAADHIAKAVAAQGVTLAFEVVGGTIASAIDAFHTAGDVALVSMRHEQAAAFAAEGAARMTGVPGFAMATSGPGATNLLTGVASCYFDSTPAVFLCGQVTTADLRGDRPVRQRGFQETDVVAMAAPITKAAWRVRDEHELPELLAAAFALARDGRPGPVLLDVPMDLQGRDVAPPGVPAADVSRATPDPAAVDRVLAALAAAQRPLILAGGGLRSAGATAALGRFAERAGAPVVHSLMGVDVLPASHPLRIGMIGTYGNRWANTAIARSDLIVVLGSRLDIRQTGADIEGFAAGREIHHVDCDVAELNHRITGCHAIEAGLAEFLAVAEERATDVAPGRSAWLAELAALRARWPDTAELDGVPGINPNAFMHALGAASRAAAAYVVDVGQHQMWAAQSLAPSAGQRFLTSGGLGAMGFALPAAIGAALAVDAPVVAIAGDGGFQLNLQELQTVVETGAPVKVVILDNGVHGMVRQFQESYFDGRFPSSDWGYSAPDFARVAQAYNIEATMVAEPADLAAALQDTFCDPRRPHLLVVKVDAGANAYPKLAFGRPITEMEPLATPLPLQR